MRALLVQHDESQGSVLEQFLVEQGFKIHCVDSGEDAIAYGRQYPYDAILLHLQLPDMSGNDVIRALRHKHIETPILAMAESSSPLAIARTLDLGADNFVTLPIHCAEVMASTQALVRRAHGLATSDINVGSLHINLKTRNVCVRGQELKLSHYEYEILSKLALHRNQWVSRNEMEEYLYGGDLEARCGQNTDPVLYRVRKKFEQIEPNDFSIVSLREWGWMLTDEPQ